MTRSVYYVFSAHWDREWYQSFQDYRHRLVQFFDRVLDGWASGDLRGPFTADGQSILIEDYLEARPERRDEVLARVREGLIELGPFYVQPDEFLVSGESLIRNLRLGRAQTRQMGGAPSSAGLLADNFGHNSQMPQIFAGFGIRAALLWRGTNLVDHRLFTWRGADGTTLPAYRFGAEGYCSYAKFVRQQRFDEPRFTPQQIDCRLTDFLAEEDAKTQAGPLLAFDGGDHMEWDRPAYSVLAQRLVGAQAYDPAAPYAIRHTTLETYVGEIASLDGRIDVQLEGELREPARFPETVDKGGVAMGCGSSRVWIKQANAECETLLARWAEPFSAFAARITPQLRPDGFIDLAWKHLLQNQPHDSICGCSIDAVHEDMRYRFAQSKGIAERVTLEALRKITACTAGAGDLPEGELRCAVFNPLPTPVSETALLDLDIPSDWPAFRLFDPQGAELPYQRTAVAANQPRLRIFNTTFPRIFSASRVQVAVALDLPALGYLALSVRRADSPVRFAPAAAPGVSAGLGTLSNEHLIVKAETDGTLALTDRATGQTYTRLLAFEDRADLGDGWSFVPAPNDAARLSPGAAQAEISLLAAGPLAAALRVRLAWPLPEAYDAAASARSAHLTPLVVESTIWLRAGADQVEIETAVSNTLRDHRLRVLFPTGCQASTYLSDTPFDVVERPVGLRPDAHLFRQPDVETRPQQGWTAISDGERGLGVISAGLYESAVPDLPERPIALTLLRAFQRTVFTAGEPGGQVQGQHVFRFAIRPLAQPNPADLFQRAARLAAGLRSVQLSRLDVAAVLSGSPESALPALPLSASFLRVDGPLVLTSCRQTAAGLEVRVFNPALHPVAGAVTAPGMSRAAWVDFESNPQGDAFTVGERGVPVSLAPKQIRTLCFTR